MSIAPETVRTPTVTYARSAPARARRWGLYAVGGIVVVAGLWWAIGGASASIGGGASSADSLFTIEPMELNITLTEDGELKPRKSVELKSEVEGQTTILYIVEESTPVKQGDLLVELASDTISDRITSEQFEIDRIEAELRNAIAELEIQKNQNDSDVKKAEIDLSLAETDLEKYENGDYEKALKGAQIAIEETNLRLDRKKDEVENNEKLLKKGFTTRAKLDQLNIEYQTLQMSLEQSKLTLEILNKYERPMVEKQKTSEIEQAREALTRVEKRAQSREEQAQARVEQYQKQLDNKKEQFAKLKSQLEKCKIIAPNDGIVRYPDQGMRWSSEDQFMVGSRVYEGQTLIVLPDTSQMIVETRIHEADRHKVRDGDVCLIKVPAFPGESFRGHVSKIAKFADSTNRWLNPDLKEHTTEILLDDTETELSPGDSAEIKILIDRVDNAIAVPVQSVFSRGAKNFVFRQKGRSAEPVEVALGATNVNMVQILSGLQAGDNVLMKADDRLLAMLPTPSATLVEKPEPDPTRRRQNGAAAGQHRPAAQSSEQRTPPPQGAHRGPGGASGGGKGAPAKPADGKAPASETKSSTEKKADN